GKDYYMNFELTERQVHWRDRVRNHINTYLHPRTKDLKAEMMEGERWKILPIIEQEKERAHEAGLWNMFMPPHSGQQHVDDTFEFEGPSLTNLEYALCAEELGRLSWSSEVFNCSAPDTGNMEVLHRYGSLEQKEQWLAPLMRGEIRSV